MNRSFPFRERSGVAAIGLLLVGLSSSFAHAQQTQDTNFRMEGDKPIQIESDQLEVFDQENTAIFTGNVVVVQGPTQMRSNFMKVFYSDKKEQPSQGEAKPASTTGQNSSDIDRIEVGGKVYVNSGTQTATGDEGSFDMRANVLRLTGKEVVLSDGGNVLTGCALTVQTETGKARLEACGGNRVRMVISPDSE
ncbi:LptA/OstA family protein [Notoacmeibacter ruber]|uniref:LPS ABC transporter substrate-binding protein LptA n=1 Tax=Notoacmeibacter ruber TaxID=2670375 RepID=A0A3L7JEJ5_9HYPH|nr:LptA/OstA family protein [Notoacmeibacter ruber]RLQ86902.1 LPS ABC transporter substrate-binding protein LptA [Notoacmeibacter ruber]